MGAWGAGPFDNDDAGDWVFELEDQGVVAVRAALAPPAEPDVEEAGAAVAAAAVVGLALGAAIESSAEVDEWLAAADRSTLDELRGLAPTAAAALRRVLDGSELADLYDEAGDEGWRDQLVALEATLRR